MRVIEGTVTSGYGVAGDNLIDIHYLIESRTGLNGLVKGTLNVAIPNPYFVTANAKVARTEYRYGEELRFRDARGGRWSVDETLSGRRKTATRMAKG